MSTFSQQPQNTFRATQSRKIWLLRLCFDWFKIGTLATLTPFMYCKILRAAMMLFLGLPKQCLLLIFKVDDTSRRLPFTCKQRLPRMHVCLDGFCKLSHCGCASRARSRKLWPGSARGRIKGPGRHRKILILGITALDHSSTGLISGERTWPLGVQFFKDLEGTLPRRLTGLQHGLGCMRVLHHKPHAIGIHRQGHRLIGTWLLEGCWCCNLIIPLLLALKVCREKRRRDKTQNSLSSSALSTGAACQIRVPGNEGGLPRRTEIETIMHETINSKGQLSARGPMWNWQRLQS